MTKNICLELNEVFYSITTTENTQCTNGLENQCTPNNTQKLKEVVHELVLEKCSQKVTCYFILIKALFQSFIRYC